ncbi:MAG: sugar nucleotide-binding protein [Bacteroidota bacterium]
MKVLIIGDKGMLGNKLKSKLESHPDISVVSTSRYGIESDYCFNPIKHSLSKLLNCTNPDIVINCIAILPTKKPIYFGKFVETFIVNSIFPRKITAEANKRGIYIIEILTDGVFSGKGGNYSESSKKDSYSLYGLSKKFGEVLSENKVSIRCSLVGENSSSMENNSIFEWFRNYNSTKDMAGYVNYMWNGVTTEVFASICLGIILFNQKIQGTYHLVPKDKVSKFDLLKLFQLITEKNDIIITPTNLPKNKDLTLATNYPDMNVFFWSLTEFKEIPLISEIIIRSLLKTHKNL